jgi:hypothetical protein
MSTELTNSTENTLIQHREKVFKVIKEYQMKRINWYEENMKPKSRKSDVSKLIDKILTKDITMFALRGITTAEEYVDAAFPALESSSEETVMGNTWHKILTQISENTFDTGDITTERDGILWVCEIKSQTNTTNSSSHPQELRALRTRIEEITGRKRVSKQEVKAAFCVTRDKNPKDEFRIFKASAVQRENYDLNGFEYRYITGEKFWTWLTGYPSEIGLVMPLSAISGGDKVAEARTQCIQSLKCELLELLTKHNLSNNIDDLVKLRALI